MSTTMHPTMRARTLSTQSPTPTSEPAAARVRKPNPARSITGLLGICLLAAMLTPAIGFAQSPTFQGRPGDQLGGPTGKKGDDEDRPTRPVPEPPTLVLVGAGVAVLALGAVLRRRRHA